MSSRELSGIPLAFRTEHEVVLVKPAGMASELTSDPRQVSAISRVRAAGLPEAHLPHRLDRVTRGFLLVALSAEAIRFHNEEVRARAWSKYYLARVSGRAVGDSLLGAHKAYLRRRRDRMEVVHSGGQPSFLRVHAVIQAPGRRGEFHVVVELLTGRFHQIRAMLAMLGAPLVGDHIYGGSDGPFCLEHAAFVFRPFGEDVRARLFDPNDPEREPVAPEVVETLSRLSATTGEDFE
jgi:23S rRNA pseudouridine1911/1915/1917 synthase